jgi:hypothetical protein
MSQAAKEGHVPHYWIAIGTPDDVRKLLREEKWAQAKQRIYEDLRAEGFALDEVFFDPQAKRANVLAHTPESVDTSGLGKSLGAEAVELFTVEELGGYGGRGPAAAA